MFDNEAGIRKLTKAAPTELLGALQNPALYDHPVKHFTIIETHISWVLLTGDFVYKIKKPVNFGFVDFSTLEKRHYFCNEELRLNRRLAPDLYLDVIAIKGSPSQPHLDGTGKVIEFAVKMREFPQHDLLSTYAAEHRLEPAHIDSMADVVSEFHSLVQHAGKNTEFGSIDTIQKWSQENFEHIDAVVPEEFLPRGFQALRKWSLASNDARLAIMNERKNKGFVRECHGDLHLGNMVLIDGNVTPFDGIDFNEELRWIDTMSEIAFVAMDLQARGYPEFSWRFINRYLQATGDYAGISLLNYYFVYRALVRAKVEGLRAQQDSSAKTGAVTKYRDAIHYLQLAETSSRFSHPAIIIMYGLSGSGKSTVATQLVESLAAIQIRSDVERKRLSGFTPDDHTGSRLGQGNYSLDATKQTYSHLAELARTITQAGYTVIVDATFLKRAQRDQFEQLAEQCQVPYLLVSCEAPESVLRDRIKQRLDTGKDPSEATQDVLQHQLQSREVLTDKEQEHTFTINSSHLPLSQENLHKLKQQITTLSGHSQS